MSGINSIGNNQPVTKVVPQQPVQRQIPADAPQQLPLTDRVELSGAGEMLKALKANDIRTDKVAQVRAQIEAGTYETDDKLDAAIERLLDDLA
jgi:anti-sigma28 factor (negative regulator of flagellin synthesis)